MLRTAMPPRKFEMSFHGDARAAGSSTTDAIPLMWSLIRFVATVCAALALTPSQVSAQPANVAEYPMTEPLAAESVSLVDENGVNVALGTYQISETDVSIGPLGPGGLALVRGAFDAQGRFQHNYMAAIYRLNWPMKPPSMLDDTPHRYQVKIPGYSETFTCPTPTTCTSDDGLGGTLNLDPDNNSSTHTAFYRAADGSFGTFERVANGFGYDFDLMEWTDAASGVVTRYVYKTAQYCTWYVAAVWNPPGAYAWHEDCNQPLYARRLQSVTTSLGYQLKFTYLTNTFSAWDPTGALDPRAPNNNELEWRTVVQVTAINNAIEYCNPAADSCNVSSSWPRASYTYTGVGSAQPGMPLIFTVTTGAQDPTVARTTTYYLPETYPIPYAWFENKPTTRVVPSSSITFPGSSAPDISISYDQRGRVATVTYHGNGSTRTWSYSYSDSANPYITNQAVSRRVAPPPSQPVPSPPAPAAGYAGTIQRTTTVTNPLNQSTVYTSSVDFRSQCGIASYEYVTEWLWDLYEAYFCNTQFLDARLLSTKDPLNRTTSYQYDSFRRLTRVTRPEGNYTQYTYDARGNVTEVRQVAKPGSGLADIVTSATYPSASTCSSTPARCNKPTSITNPLGFRTDFTYDATHGGLLTVTLPAPSGSAPVGSGTRPQTRYTYATFNARYLNSPSTFVYGPSVYRLVQISSCATQSSCNGTADETRTTIAYQTSGSPNNVLEVSVTVSAGNGSVSATESYTYDSIGNRVTVDGPLAGTADTTRTYYNAHREIIGVIDPDPDGSGPLLHRAVRTLYNGRGQRTVVEKGTTTSQSSSFPTAFSGFVTLERTETRYNGFGLPADTIVWSGSSILTLTEKSYDNALRPLCTAVRMNPSQFASLAANQANDACALGTQGSFGPDRIERLVYDAAGQVTTRQSAYGTSLQQNTVTTTYSNNGQPVTLTDANGNRTTYAYDGFDRLVRIRYPHPTSTGTSSTTDYEEFTFDQWGRLIQERRRSGEIFSFSYDNLSRQTTRTAPGSQPNVTTSYDLLSRVVSQAQTGHTVSTTYDALSRVTSVNSSVLGTVSYLYDAAGRRTRITWPDGFYIVNDYNVAGDLTAIRENGATSGVGVLASYTYDGLGRPTSLTRGNGAVTSWSYDTASRLTTLAHNPAGSAHDISVTFAYNPSSQLTSRTRNNPAFDYQVPASTSTSYTRNGLNQYTSVGGVSITHDARGNLTNDGLKAYGYDFDNRLTSVSGGTVLAYDPLGRLHQIAGGATTRFLYDGDRVIAEMSGSGTVLRRYVHGPGLDEPLVWYEGAGTSDRRWLLADERGSVIAIANAAGTVTNVNRYDAYGVPAATNVGRFQYTGQMWLPEAELYHYKARAYHPRFGRFMQTDPARYEDGLNLYAYTGNDPISRIDPSGEIALGVLSKAIKIAIKGGDIASTFNGIAQDVAIIASRSASPGARLAAAASLASEIFSPVSARDAKAIAAAVNRTPDLGRLKGSNVGDAPSGRTYQTYTKTNPETGEVYSGRTSGTGSPSENVAQRDKRHHMNQFGFGPAVLDKSSKNADAIRGREQLLIEANGGAKSMGGTSGNRINAIAPDNPRREEYIEEALKEFY